MYNCKYCGKECKNDNSLRNHERLCKNNPDRQLTTYEKYGPINGFNKRGTHVTPWNLGLTKATSEKLALISQKIKNFYAEHGGNFTGKHHTEATKKKLSIKASINNVKKFDKPSGKGKRGYYNNIYCQSSWELAYVLYCIDNNISFKRNNKYFPYEFEGQLHNYFPDFYLPDTDYYVEVKGYYDKRSKAKAEQFPGKLIVLDFVKMQPILEYVENKYGKDFTQLYDKSKVNIKC